MPAKQIKIPKYHPLKQIIFLLREAKQQIFLLWMGQQLKVTTDHKTTTT